MSDHMVEVSSTICVGVGIVCALVGPREALRATVHVVRDIRSAWLDWWKGQACETCGRRGYSLYGAEVVTSQGVRYLEICPDCLDSAQEHCIMGDCSSCPVYEDRCGTCVLQGGPNCEPDCPNLPDCWECPLL